MPCTPDQRAGVIRVESRGSVWMMDDDLRRYCRFPKEEKPRENGWGGPEAGALQDAVWHPMIAWEIDTARRLVITVPHENPDKVGVLVAPMAEVIQ